MTRSLTFAAALVAMLAAGCSDPQRDESDEPGDAPTPPARPTLRLDLSNTTPEAEPRQTVVDLALPNGWRTASDFEGSWTQPAEAPTLMLVASGYDDGHRAGTYEAKREAGRISIDLHPTYADNNVTLAFTMVTETGGVGRWGHATFVGYQEKGPVEVSVLEP